MFKEPWAATVWRPVLSTPQLCTYEQLVDGTYSIDDLADFNEILNYKDALAIEAQPKPKQGPLL